MLPDFQDIKRKSSIFASDLLFKKVLIKHLITLCKEK